MADVIIRLAIASDAEAISAIYNREVTTSTATFDLVPRTLTDQLAWLAARSGAFSAIVAVLGGDEDGTVGDGAVDGGTVDGGAVAGGMVVGFASLSPYKERAAYRTTVEDSVYVHPDHTGRGIGRLLLGRLVDIARNSGFHSVIARIEAGGLASRALHTACGFDLVGVERQVGRKFGRWLDVAVMQIVL
jgi:L-amino acid N-acyltransferase